MILTKLMGKEDYKEQQKRRREERKAAEGATVPEGWKEPAFTSADNPHGRLFGRSDFAIMFPKYREKYIREVWPLVKSTLKGHFINCQLDLLEGTMVVMTTNKTFDPYSIIKARDFIKLLARSVPVEQARRVMEDDIFAEIMPISHSNRERFLRRRNRLIGPDGATLKAMELLTKCYILVHGKTVCAIGPYKGVVQVKKIADDCMKNIHPVQNIKAFMVMNKLKENKDLEGQDWSRFLPKTKGKTLNRRKKPHKIQKKKEYTPFPPDQKPRKEDIEMAQGVYFLKEAERQRLRTERKRAKAKEVEAQRKKERAAAFVPPSEAPRAAKRPKVEAPGEQLAKDLKKIKRMKRK